MFEDTIKIHLIEEVLKLDDRTVLKELETILKRSKIKMKPQSSEATVSPVVEGICKRSWAGQKGRIKLQSAKAFLNEL